MILSMWMCVCVSGCYMCAGDYRGQKSAWKILEAGSPPKPCRCKEETQVILKHALSY